MPDEGMRNYFIAFVVAGGGETWRRFGVAPRDPVAAIGGGEALVTVGIALRGRGCRAGRASGVCGRTSWPARAGVGLRSIGPVPVQASRQGAPPPVPPTLKTTLNRQILLDFYIGYIRLVP